MPQARAAAKAAIQPGQRVAYAPVYPGGPTGAPQTIAQFEVALPPEVEAILANWPEGPKNAVRELAAKYGPPQEACAGRIVWTRNGPWRETIVTREEIPHYWPTPHTDYVEQSVDFKVELDKFGPISEYDGSAWAERTKGSLSSRCGSEAMNFLTINLAIDVALGELSPGEAQDVYIEAAKMRAEGQEHPYTQGLIFDLPTGYQGDPGERVF